MNISFFGAAGEVTGSCYLVETESSRFLVDCGLFQGQDAGRKNRAVFPFDPATLDFVLLTHAHIDHSGLLPALTAQGFAGPIIATRATCDLVDILLLDSAHIQESNAERAREWARKGDRLREPESVTPVYGVADAKRCLRQLQGVGYGLEVRPHPTVRVRFQDAGHILGSSILEIWVDSSGGARKLVFSGDLGQPDHPLVNDFSLIEEADTLVVESTYGDRLHRPMAQTTEELVAAINETLTRRRGNILIPAFAVGRTQDLLFILSDLAEAGRLATKPRLFVDSPMARAATEITFRHHRLLDEAARGFVQRMQSRGRTPLPVTFTESVEDSRAINQVQSGAIIMAASGMCDAGRIKHHLRHNLPRPECSVLFVGYQAQGTLGRRLVDGADRVRIFGEEVPVRAQRHTIGGLSAHGDQAALLKWLDGFRQPPRQCFVVHGEAAARTALAGKIQQALGWEAQLPGVGERYTLG